MPIIDCYTLLGAWPDSEVELSVEVLSAAMAARGVSRSLVTHTTAIFYDSTLGNDQVRQLCEGNDQLEPVAVLNPLAYPSCLEEADRCRAAGFRVFRLCPREHGYPFSGSVGSLRELLPRLEGAALLLADLAGLPAPAVAADLPALLPLPTALSVDSGALGTVLHAAAAGPQIRVETSYLDAGGAIEAAVRELGAGRVLFGSGSPVRALGPAVMTVQYAELGEPERQAVFEGNLQSLLAS